jgi:hypothetical protein
VLSTTEYTTGYAERVDDRNRKAAGHVRLLLAADTDHPMFEAVALLREDLQHVLNLLTGVGDGR